MSKAAPNERLLISGLIQSPELAVASGLQAQDFAVPECRAAFVKLMERLAAGDVVSSVTCGWSSTSPTPTPEETATLARDLWGAAVARRLATEAGRLLESGIHGDAFLEALGAAVDRVGRGGGSTPSVRALGQQRASELLLDRSSSRVPTGYSALDSKIGGGLLRGVPCVVGARTGHGKSAFALGITRNVVRRGGKAIVFSLEDAARQYVDRVFALETGIPASDLERGARDVTGPASRLPEGWWLDDTAGLTSRAISRRARLLAHRAGKVDLVVVDYIQLVRGEKESATSHEKIAQAMADLTKLARDLDCPVLVLSQINRRVEHEGRPPTLADLKESGSLEECAKMVLLCSRPGFGQSVDRTFEVHVAKSSFSGSGTTQFQWDGPLCKVS